MKKSLSKFSKNLATIRKQKGLSQQDLANLSGISSRMIGYYEKHAAYPPMDKIEIFAKALNVEISDLLGIDDNLINSDNLNVDNFDIRTLKKLKNIFMLNRQDRLSIYKMIDLLLQKEEYKHIQDSSK